MSDQPDVTVDVDQVVRVMAMFEAAAGGIDLGDVGQSVVTAVDNKIQAEGAVASYARWPELSDSVKARRPGAKMLQGPTGLLASVQAQAEGSMSVVIRSPAPYAGFHITGHLIPRRDFFELDFDSVLEECGLRALEQVDR